LSADLEAREQVDVTAFVTGNTADQMTGVENYGIVGARVDLDILAYHGDGQDTSAAEPMT